MPTYIMKFQRDGLEPRYLEWSTIVDSPVTDGLPLEDFKLYYEREYGREGMRRLGERLKRVEEKGVSSFYDPSIDDVLLHNRAGPNSTELSYDEIYDAYCTGTTPEWQKVEP